MYSERKNFYLKPASTHNGSIRTDLPLTVVSKANKKTIAKMTRPGQLICVGKVYLKTQKVLVRIM
jgi:hypothetical protein